MNKSGEKVNLVQLRENEKCLMDFQKEKLDAPPMTFDDCMTADRRGKMQKAEQKAVVQEQKKCNPLDPAPPFAYTDSTTVNAAAVRAALELAYAIFGGPPVLDANLVVKADDKDAAKCQIEMLKRANKLENTILKEMNKAKKQSLKDATVRSGEALEARLQAVLSSNEKIDRVQDMLVKAVDKNCAALQVAPDTIFPGACGAGDPNLGEIETCVIAAIRCEACVSINQLDDLNLNCDQMDDRAANGSCP